ncbi:MAG: SF1B family DNA helicase RecD2 [bacterium]
MQIEAVIENIVFYNEENSFVILKAKLNNKIITAKGSFPDFSVVGNKDKAKNMNIILNGQWIKDPKYGEQFNAETISINQDGILFFLINIVKGLGESLAKKLINEYGETELVKILDFNPDKLKEFKGIKEKKLEKIIESWKKYKYLKNLTKFFAEHKVAITGNLLVRVYKHFERKKEDVIKSINENPYVLSDIRGVGFKTADKIALQIGIQPYEPIRIKALLDYILQTQAQEKGHTYLYKEDLLDLALDFSPDENKNIFKIEQVINEILLSYPDSYYSDDNNRIALNKYYFQENYILNNLLNRNKNKNKYSISEKDALAYISEKEKELGKQFGDKQKDAILKISAGGHNVFVLCGYAGTGKSTISKVILDYYLKYFDKSDIITCAFTGMASKRIKEATGYNASTIHSLLNLGYGDKQNKKDNESEDNDKLEQKVILIDEASMINLQLFYYLIKAISKDTVIILVGDDAQLPPIGEGNVFADLLNKKLPIVKLDKIYRQSEDSVLTYFADFIRRGTMPANITGNYKDFSFIVKDIPNYINLKKTKDEKELREIRDIFNNTLQKELLDEIDNLISKENIKGVKRIWEIQIITPMKITPLGTKALNDILQEKLNDIFKIKTDIRGYALKQFDKVIHLKNQNMPVQKITYKKYLEIKGSGKSIEDIFTGLTCRKERIFNGNLGLVLDIDIENENFIVGYTDPDGNTTLVMYSFDDYKNIIDLGYALTVHKTQGNQFEYVFIPFITGFFIMLNNKLTYTAITRAKKKATLIGQPYAFKRACTNIEAANRNTFMGLEKLK